MEDPALFGDAGVWVPTIMFQRYLQAVDQNLTNPKVI